MRSHIDEDDGCDSTTENPEGTKLMKIIESDKKMEIHFDAWWKMLSRRRYIVTILACLGFFNVYSLRVNLSVAIVAMTSEHERLTPHGNVTYVKDFEWDSKIQGLILGSFFYGYMISQIPASWLANKIGGSKLFGWSIASTSFFTLLTPCVAYFNVYVLIALRIIEGILEGATHPAISTLWSRWAPPLERSRLMTITFSGCYIGTIVSLPVSGTLADRSGWPSVFYVFGAVGLLWFSLWCIIVKESPEADLRITKEELQYIQESLHNNETQKVESYPWREIITSLPVCAVVTAHFVDNWGFYTLLTQLPSFMKDTLGFDMESAGFISAVPYLIQTIVIQFSGHIADLLQKKKLMDTTKIRKLYICGAFFCQTVFMLLAAFLSSPYGIIICLSIAVGFESFSWASITVNHLDLSPKHAGVIMGISQTIATSAGMISPVVTGFIVQDHSAEQWKIVFYIASGVYLFGAVCYGVYGSAKRQQWGVQGDSAQRNDENSSTI